MRFADRAVVRHFPFLQDYHLFIFATQMEMRRQILDQTSQFSNRLLAKLRRWRALTVVLFCNESVFPAVQQEVAALTALLSGLVILDQDEYLSKAGGLTRRSFCRTAFPPPLPQVPSVAIPGHV